MSDASDPPRAPKPGTPVETPQEEGAVARTLPG